MSVERQFSFAGYRLDLGQRVLFRGGEPVSLTPRAFDLLALLVSNSGRVVSKEEILKEVWGQTIVEDGTVTWHLHSLRQSLANGDESAHFIDTVPKRGYRFIAPLTDAVDRRKPVDPPSIPTMVPKRSRRAWGIAAGAVVLAALAFFSWRAPREPTLPYAKRDWLLISNFENQTGEPRFDRALLTALTVSLEQSTFVNVFPRTRVATTLERMRKPADSAIDESLAREICVREGLRALVTPSITRTGKEYAVAARLTDPKTGNTVRAYLIRAEDESRILGALQELAMGLRRDLGESINEIEANNRPLEQVTTPVLAALQLYSEGMDEWAHARISKATQAFEAAVAADPEFAMAYAALGKLKYGVQFNRPDLGNEYFQRALALSARTTNRERQLIAADFAASRGQVGEARKLYQAYSISYPDDLRMHSRMGELLLGAGLLREAIVALTAAVKVDPHDARSIFNIGIAHAKLNDFVEARRQVERAVALEPGIILSGTFSSTYGLILFGAGDRAAADEYFRKQLSRSGYEHRAERALGLIDMYDGKYASAATRFRAANDRLNRANDTNLARARNHGYLAAVLAARGDRKAALHELDLGVASLDTHGPAPIGFRTRFAEAYCRLGNLPAAARQLEKVISGVDSRPYDRATVQYTQGVVALANGKAADAAGLFREALRGEPGAEVPLILDSLARAAEATGDRAGAIDAYQRLLALRGSSVAWEAQEPWLLAHYQLARLYHARGEEVLAAQALEPLLAIWANADDDLPFAIEARRLHAAITGNAKARQ